MNYSTTLCLEHNCDSHISYLQKHTKKHTKETHFTKRHIRQSWTYVTHNCLNILIGDSSKYGAQYKHKTQVGNATSINNLYWVGCRSNQTLVKLVVNGIKPKPNLSIEAIDHNLRVLETQRWMKT